MPIRDLLLILVVCLVWAGNFLASAYALEEVPAFEFTALRMVILALVLVPFLKAPPKGQWRRLLAVALCNNVFHFGLSFWALKLAGDLSSVAIVAQSYVPMASLLAWVVLGERFGWRTGAAIAVSFTGVLVIGFDPTVMQQPASLLLMLVSAGFLALGTVLMRRLVGLDMVSQQGWSSIIAVGPLVALSLLFEPGALAALPEASWVVWAGVLYSAVFSSLLGHGLYYVLVQRHEIAQLTPWLLLTPVLAVILGIVVWGDQPGPQLWVGGVMVLGGVLIIALRALARSRSLPVPPTREI